MIGKNVQIRYVWKGNAKNNTRRKKGILLALKQDGKLLIGFSYCNGCEKFNTERGYDTALNRAIKYGEYKNVGIITYQYCRDELATWLREDGVENVVWIPEGMVKDIKKFIEKCFTQKSYEGLQKPEWANNVLDSDFVFPEPIV